MKDKIRVGLNIVGSKDWMGGVSYIQHLASALNYVKVEENLLIYVVCNANMMYTLDLHAELLKLADGLIIRDTKAELASLSQKISGQVVSSDKELFDHIDILLPINMGVFSDFPAISWIPDFQYKHLPHLNTPGQLSTIEQLVSKICKESSHLYFSSHNAKKDFNHFYPKAYGKQYVLPFCANPNYGEILENLSSKVLNKYELNEKYFICPNQFWQHKAHDVLFKAIQELKSAGISIKVVCTGTGSDIRSPDYSKRLFDFIDENQLNDQIILTGMLSYSDLLQLLVHSSCIVHPSRFEGWSTVVEDAKALEIPIILSDIDVHQEQSPDKSRFFKLDDKEELKQALHEMWNSLEIPNPKLRIEVAKENNKSKIQEYGMKAAKLIKDVLQDFSD